MLKFPAPLILNTGEVLIALHLAIAYCEIVIVLVCGIFAIIIEMPGKMTGKKKKQIKGALSFLVIGTIIAYTGMYAWLLAGFTLAICFLGVIVWGIKIVLFTKVSD